MGTTDSKGKPVTLSERPEPRRDSAVVLAVTSGKGGVGKTSLSVNMGVEFARCDYRTVVVDCDLGLANTHILAGIKPDKTLSDFIEKRATLPEIIADATRWQMPFWK